MRGWYGGKVTVGKEVARFARWERVDQVTRKRIVSLRESGMTLERFKSEDGVLTPWKIQRKLDPKTAVATCHLKFVSEQAFKQVA